MLLRNALTVRALRNRQGYPVSLTPDERETTVNAHDNDETVRIWSCQRRYITKMRNHPAFTEIDKGVSEDTEWAQFTIPAADWSPTGVKHRRTMTAEQKAAAGLRLTASRVSA